MFFFTALPRLSLSSFRSAVSICAGVRDATLPLRSLRFSTAVSLICAGVRDATLALRFVDLPFDALRAITHLALSLHLTLIGVLPSGMGGIQASCHGLSDE